MLHYISASPSRCQHSHRHITRHMQVRLWNFGFGIAGMQPTLPLLPTITTRINSLRYLKCVLDLRWHLGRIKDFLTDRQTFSRPKCAGQYPASRSEQDPLRRAQCTELYHVWHQPGGHGWPFDGLLGNVFWIKLIIHLTPQGE